MAKVLSLVLLVGLAAVCDGQNAFAENCEIGSEDCIQCDAGSDPTCLCNRNDFIHWASEGFYTYEGALQDCTLELIGSGVTPEQYAVCLGEDPRTAPYSNNCSVCFGRIMDCTINSCVSSCVSFDLRDNPACRQCVIENCEAIFFNCSGWPTASCNKCTNPSSSIIPGFPDGYLFGAFGGIAFIAVVLGAVACRRRSISDNDDLGELDYNEGSNYQLKIDPSPRDTMQTVDTMNSNQVVRGSSPPGYSGSPQFRAGSFDYNDLDEISDKPDI